MEEARAALKEESVTHRIRPLLFVAGALLTLSVAFGLMLSAFAPAASADQRRRDPGIDYQRDLIDHSEDYFGFGRPVAKAADTPSSTLPGPKAVEVARGLRVSLVSDMVGQNADQMALWPNDEKPEYAIFCNEINGTSAGSPATVQRVNLKTGEVSDMVFGMRSCDPALRTPWGTILVGEESGSSGRAWEIMDPLNVNGVQVDRVAGTSSDPAHVAVRGAMGQVSYEGVVVMPDGSAYYGDELRPSSTKVGGGIYKFVPSAPYTGGSVSSLDESPLASGSVYVLRLGLRGDLGQGNNTGAGKWFQLSSDSDNAGDLAAQANAAGGYTGYYRPERMAIDPIAAAEGRFRACWTNTGNDVAANWGEVMCMTDAPTSDAGFPTGAAPVVEPFVIGNPSLRMPDNLMFQPKTGILYLLMDASTSAEGDFTNDDVWACLPDGADTDILTDGCVRVMTLKDGNAEFTGIHFLADGKSFLINLQHRTQEGRAVQGTTDMIRVAGLKVPGGDDHRGDR